MIIHVRIWINLLLNVTKNNPGKRVNELSEIIKRPQKTVERWISILKKSNKIVHKGSKKTGGYYAVL